MCGMTTSLDAKELEQEWSGGSLYLVSDSTLWSEDKAMPFLSTFTVVCNGVM